MLFLSRKRKWLEISFVICVIAGITTGCVPMVVCTGIGTGAYTAMRNKNVGESISDTKIESVIKAKLYKISPELYSNVSVSVDRGCVLLTGAVMNSAWVYEAERASWGTDGIVVVDNNIIFGQTISFGTMMHDGVLTSKIRGKLICAKDVRSGNYKIKTMDGVVYVRGIATSKHELRRVLEAIQHVQGIKKVVSYVMIQNNK